jgi:hypothetical protein
MNDGLARYRHGGFKQPFISDHWSRTSSDRDVLVAHLIVYVDEGYAGRINAARDGLASNVHVSASLASSVLGPLSNLPPIIDRDCNLKPGAP